MAPHLLHYPVAVNVDEVDRKPHAEGMDGLARNNPQTSTISEAITSQQPLAPCRPMVGHFHTVPKRGTARAIDDLQSGHRLRRGTVISIPEEVHHGFLEIMQRHEQWPARGQQ